MSEKHYLSTIINQPNPSKNKNRKKVGLKWLFFWNYFSLPFGSILGMITYLSNPEELLILLAISILQLIIAYGLHKRKMWAWSWNWILLLIGFVSMVIPYFSLVNSSGIGAIILETVFRFIISCIIWMWPNSIYWRKRMFLFMK